MLKKVCTVCSRYDIIKQTKRSLICVRRSDRKREKRIEKMETDHIRNFVNDLDSDGIVLRL